MSRARGGGLVSLLVALVAVAGCGGGGGSSASTPSSSTKELVGVNTGGGWGACQRKSFFYPFTAQTGVKVIDGPFLPVGQVKAMVQSRQYNVDVVYPSANFA